MFPYFPPAEVRIGPLTFHAFGALVAIAVLVGGAIINDRAPRRGLPKQAASRLLLWMFAAGFLGAHAAKVVEDGRVFTDPWILLEIWDGLYSFGGIAGGILGILACALVYRLSRVDLWRFLDVAAYAFPFAWIFGRLGCALAHDHPGAFTSSWLGVRFPEGARFDLGLLEFLFTLLVAAAFFALDRKPRQPGFYFGLLLVVYGPFRLLLDQLHEPRPESWLTPDGCFSVAALSAGAFALISVVRQSHRSSMPLDI